MQDHDRINRPTVELLGRELLRDSVLLELPDRRAGWWALVLTGLMLALGIYLLFGASQLLERFQAVDDGDSARIRQYNQHLQSLQDLMNVFVADSVET